MAYADGQLDPAERANVEASIRELPEYQRKVEKFRATLKPVHQAFQERMDRGHLALAARIRQEVPATASASQSIGPSHAQSRASLLASYFPSYATWPVALAASLALLVGGGLG